MAAKSSCTKVQWGSIKPKAPKMKSYAAGNKMSHAKLAALWGAQGGKFADAKRPLTKKEIDRKREASLQAKRDAAAAAEAVEGEEVDDEPVLLKPHELAAARMAALAEELQQALFEKLTADFETSPGSLRETLTAEELRELADARGLQLDELAALEAFFPDEFAMPADLEELRSASEELQAAGASANPEAVAAVAEHPVLECLLQLTVPDHRGGSLVASVLLAVRFPPKYPHAPPELRLEDAMITDSALEFGEDKVLHSEGYFQEEELIAAMLEQTAAVLPDPCIYELTNWLTENAFSYLAP